MFFVSPLFFGVPQLEQTPLHVASSCGNRAAVSVLLDLNADPEATDRKGRVAGLSFLRQVSKRARADIRSMLTAAIAGRKEPEAACSAFETEEFDQTLAKTVMRRASSTSSCEEAAPLRRPSLPSMLNLLPGWGMSGRGAGGSVGGAVSSGGGCGETSFGAVPVLSPRLA